MGIATKAVISWLIFAVMLAMAIFSTVKLRKCGSDDAACKKKYKVMTGVFWALCVLFWFIMLFFFYNYGQYQKLMDAAAARSSY